MMNQLASKKAEPDRKTAIAMHLRNMEIDEAPWRPLSAALLTLCTREKKRKIHVDSKLIEMMEKVAGICHHGFSSTEEAIYGLLDENPTLACEWIAACRLVDRMPSGRKEWGKPIKELAIELRKLIPADQAGITMNLSEAIKKIPD